MHSAHYRRTFTILQFTVTSVLYPYKFGIHDNCTLPPARSIVGAGRTSLALRLYRRTPAPWHRLGDTTPGGGVPVSLGVSDDGEGRGDGTSEGW